MYRVIKVVPEADYRLFVVFEDGTQGEIDLTDRLFGPMFEPLKKADLFTQVDIDEFGTICWPNGADLAPDALHRQLSGQSQKV